MNGKDNPVALATKPGSCSLHGNKLGDVKTEKSRLYLVEAVASPSYHRYTEESNVSKSTESGG